MFLHAPQRRQPPLSNGRQKKPDARSSHRSRGARSPAEKPEIAANLEVQIHDHVTRVHGHPLVHVHVRAIIVREDTRVLYLRTESFMRLGW